jgi:hypothetical protein
LTAGSLEEDWTFKLKGVACCLIYDRESTYVVHGETFWPELAEGFFVLGKNMSVNGPTGKGIIFKPRLFIGTWTFVGF